MKRILGLLVLGLCFAIGWFWMAFQSAVESPLIDEGPVYIEIEKGSSFNGVINTLAKRGLLEQPFWFKLLALQRGEIHKLKAGEYELPAGTDMRRLLALLVSGRNRQHVITFVEGWSFQQVLDALGAHPAVEHTLGNKGFGEIMAILDASQDHPEGLFFPDTYFFTRGTLDIALLERAYKKMERVLAKQWKDRADNLPFSTPYEALILASIIEKETARVEERGRIAGVFVRRLEKGMLLQTDPTVIYGIGDKFDGDIRSKDLRADTPYNTYIHPGLPPTPIAMPGADAIHAALNPAGGSSLYFVARGDGTHVFSSSLTDHEKAVDIFQRGNPNP